MLVSRHFELSASSFLSTFADFRFLAPFQDAIRQHPFDLFPSETDRRRPPGDARSLQYAFFEVEGRDDERRVEENAEERVGESEEELMYRYDYGGDYRMGSWELGNWISRVSVEGKPGSERDEGKGKESTDDAQICPSRISSRRMKHLWSAQESYLNLFPHLKILL